MFYVSRDWTIMFVYCGHLTLGLGVASPHHRPGLVECLNFNIDTVFNTQCFEKRPTTYIHPSTSYWLKMYTY